LNQLNALEFANRGSWALSSCRSYISPSSISELQKLNTKFCIRTSDYDKSSELYSILNSQLSNNKVVLNRQCVSCAKKAYHSVLFEYGWLTHCPVHNEKLVSKCPECNSNWPKASELQRRKCNLCGIQRTMEMLIENNAFNSKPYEEIIPKFMQFLTTKISNIYSFRAYPFSIPTTTNNENSRNNTRLGLIAFYKNMDELKRSNLKEYGLKIPTFYSRKVRFTKLSNSSCNESCATSDLLLMSNSRKQIFRIALRALKYQANHELGSCPKKQNSDHYDCAYCETWRQLKTGFVSNLKERNDQVVMRYNPPLSSEVVVHDPGLINDLFDDEIDQAMLIDDKTKFLIYKVELWLCIRKMFIQIDFYLNNSFDVNNSYIV